MASLHDAPWPRPLVANLASILAANNADCAGLPTVPTHNSCAVYNLGFEAFHGRGHRFDPDQVHQLFPIL